jgi:hypothetical protein
MRRQELQGDAPLELKVLGLVDNTHTAVADFLDNTVFPGNELVLHYDRERCRQGFRQGIGHPGICRERYSALPAEVRRVGVVKLAFRAFHDQLTLADARMLSPRQMLVNGETRPLFCAQFVPKICQEYRNLSKDIELFRNPKDPKNVRISWKCIYSLHLSFFRRFLHTVEVRGSSPLSPTILFNNLRTP